MLIYDIKWEASTAGPSPNGYRIELFTFGCKKAMSGNPCKGCFNSSTWDSSRATKSYTPREIADNINKFAPNKYITIGGGEPSDQIDELIELCKYLKEYGFHIMVYTWRQLKHLFDKNKFEPQSLMYQLEARQFENNMKQLLNHIDMLVDGSFNQDECMYKEDAEDGTFNSVGSGNQIIWDIKNKTELEGYALKGVKYIYLDENDNLKYKLRDNAEKQIIKI